jgi:tRNA dimethylallyltransferase
MMAAGWVEEVKSLGQKYGFDLPLLNTLGYQEIKQYLLGEITLSEAESLIVLRTRQFAKRQRTWFRAVPDIEWFDADDPALLPKIGLRVGEFLAFNETTHRSPDLWS